MTTQNHYYTYCFISKQDGSYAGWNSEIASSKEEAIRKALQRSHEEDDYKVDVNSFTKQTDDEMEKLMYYTF